MDFFNSVSKNKVGRITFLTFKIIALVFFVVYFILNIYTATKVSSFMVFLSDFLNNVLWTTVLFGIGRIIDLLACKMLDEQNKEENKKGELK